ncbi:MAG: hypothetical protein KC877_03330, partial [Candidatus Kaiserbacteria bacterium]|nr:hypothetical protein [Candidatus Kaiserbacteria bacterium]
MNELPHSPWSDTTDEVAQSLQTDPKHGLTDLEVTKRRKMFGENIFESRTKQGPLSIFMRQFASPLISILCLAVVITALLQEWLDTAIIAFAIIINAILGFIQEYKAEKAIDSLRSYITHRTLVIRDGHETEIDPRYIVPGDILHITHGARITADARLIREINFTADEAILTGESLPVEKDIAALSETTPLPERHNMVYAGTLGIDGSAYAIVTATAYDTEIGKLAQLVDETESEKTPLQMALSKLTWAIIVFTALAVAGLFAIGLVQDRELTEMLIISIAVF